MLRKGETPPTILAPSNPEISQVGDVEVIIKSVCFFV